MAAAGSLPTRTVRQRVAVGLPLGPIVACIAGAVLVWLATGVRPLEVAALLAYEGVFVLAPGILALRALLDRPGSPLTQLALGWPLGYALELAAFAGTAAIGARWLFLAHPAAVAGVAVLVGRRRSRGRPADPGIAVSRNPARATAVIVLIGCALLGFGYFASNPLPRSVPDVVLYVDNVFDISIAAEAGEHWPITNPNVSGEPLRYHVFAFVHAAAIAQVTGVDLDVIFLRYLPIALLLIVALQMTWLAGRATRGSPWVATGAVAIVLLAGELDIDIDRIGPFGGLFMNDFPQSPTFAFGLPFSIAVIGLLLGLLTRRKPGLVRTWVLLAVLLAGGMGAKLSTLPPLLVALGLFLFARAVLDRTVDRRALAALGLALIVFVVVFVAVFSGGGNAGARIDPFDILDYTVFGSRQGTGVPIFVGAVCLGALFAPWLGGLLLLRSVGGEQRIGALWLGAVAIGAVLLTMVVAQPGLSQIYFLHYGVPAAAVLSGWGIIRLVSPGMGRRVLAAAVAALGSAALASVILYMAGASASTRTYLAVLAGLAAAILLIAFVAGRGARSMLQWGVGLLVVVTLLDAPLDVLPDWGRQERAGLLHYTRDLVGGPPGIDAGMLSGLRWLRDHSRRDDVLTIDGRNQAGEEGDGKNFYYAAYAERRTFLGGWSFTRQAVAARARGQGMPFTERFALNAAAYAGNREALDTLHDRYGVRFVLVDLRHAPPAPALDRILDLVFANASLRVYRVSSAHTG